MVDLSNDGSSSSANNSQVLCSLRYQQFVVPHDEIWCGWAWDSILCWPPTRASTTARQRCPLENGIDTTRIWFIAESAEVNSVLITSLLFIFPQMGFYSRQNIGSAFGAGLKMLCQYQCQLVGSTFVTATWDFTAGGPLAQHLLRGSKFYANTNANLLARQFAERRCNDEGRWEGRGGALGDRPYSVDFPNGWTNYTPCFTPEMLLLIRKLYTGNEDAAKVKLEIAERTRTLEFVGLSVSLAALAISLAIFCRFRSLRNTRTRIHKNLFVAMVIQVVIRLTLYIDQALLRSGAYGFQYGIKNTPILCEASYVLLEYARTAMFMWMFIEGFFLHNMVTVFQETSYYRMYRLIGWGLPVVMTLTWAIITALYYHPSKCWWGYNLTLYFWILEGPRMAVILLNFLFLMNIVRVLLKKLRESHTSEIEQVRKAVRAAVVLLPLLGITNIISMFGAPLEKTTWFALWSYTTHFLTSFQGLFIATLYCFLNGEVRLALNKTFSVYLSLRGNDLQTRRQSTLSGSQPHRITPAIEVEEGELRPSGWIRLCCRGGSTPPPDRPLETTV